MSEKKGENEMSFSGNAAYSILMVMAKVFPGMKEDWAGDDRGSRSGYAEGQLLPDLHGFPKCA